MVTGAYWYLLQREDNSTLQGTSQATPLSSTIPTFDRNAPHMPRHAEWTIATVAKKMTFEVL